jgi:ABC-type dipeptide/oligopeptide/nickel transport system ATPase component
MIFQEPMLALDPVFTIGHSPASPSAASTPQAATLLPRRQEAWLGIFVARCSLPCDPPALAAKEMPRRLPTA